jgi:FkbM family methyltransferase
MFLLSRILDTAVRAAGPRVAYDVQLWRMRRWGKCDPEWLRLDELVDPKRAAVDVGANWGVYTGRLAQLSSHVHALEPLPWLADALAAKTNPSKVTIHRVAASDHPGSTEIRVPYFGDREENGRATIEAQNPLAGMTQEKRIVVDLARLDDLLSMPVGFIKIDVEGHELAVLQGCPRILTEQRPVILVESVASFRPGAPFDIVTLLASSGYRGSFLADGAIRPIESLFTEPGQTVAEAGATAEASGINNFIFRPWP